MSTVVPRLLQPQAVFRGAHPALPGLAEYPGVGMQLGGGCVLGLLLSPGQIK